MKIKPRFVLMIVLMLLVVLVAAPSISYAKGKGASANGHGKYQFIDPIGGVTEYDETLRLNAREVNDEVKGKLVLISGKNNENVDYLLLKGEVDCLRVKADGKTAVISGYLTKIEYPAFPELAEPGDGFWIQLQDNGQGKKGDPDLRSEIFINHFFRKANDDEFLNDCTVDYPLRDAAGDEIPHPYQALFLPGGKFKVIP